MLAAISLGAVSFGLPLITAFSIGLAGVLILGGPLMVSGRLFMARLLERRRSGGHAPGHWWKMAEPAFRRLPILSAAAIAVLGLVIVAQSAQALGFIR
jgi:ABC-type nickel/cobalt efflux system permease component RcnA